MGIAESCKLSIDQIVIDQMSVNYHISMNIHVCER